MTRPPVAAPAALLLAALAGAAVPTAAHAAPRASAAPKAARLAPALSVAIAGRTATVRWQVRRGLAWTAVERRTAKTAFRVVVRRRGGAVARISGLRPGTRYGFRVVQRLRGGGTLRGRVVWARVARPLPSGPVTARVSLAGRGAAVSWDPVAGVSKWIVTRRDLSTGQSEALPPVIGQQALDGLPATADGHWVAYDVTAAGGGATGRTTAVRSVGLPAYARHIAIGDSFSSGAGVGGVQGDAGCGQSPKAWPRRLPTSIAPAPTLLACNGASIPNLLRSGDGGVPQIGTTTQLDRLAAAVGSTQVPTLVSVSIGGNDANVIGLLVECIRSACKTDEGATLARIRGPVRQALDRLFTQIRAAAPGADVLALPYPQLLTGSTGWGNPLAMFALGGDERDVLARVIDALDHEIEASATAHGAAVSTAAIQGRFAGHQLGAGQSYLTSMAILDNPFGLAKDFFTQVTGTASQLAPLHPNEDGTAAQAAAAEQALRAFAGGSRAR